jgi:hypothetical protein
MHTFINILFDPLSLLKISAFFVVAGLFNFGRYLYYNKRLIRLADKLKPEIREALVRSEFKAFLKEPNKVGDVSVDLIWFKTHFAVVYTVFLFLFATLFLVGSGLSVLFYW